MNVSSLQSVIEQKISEHLAPVALVIENFSQQHAGHAGYSADGESHFRVEIVSAAFEGLSRVSRQRLVYNLLATELDGKLHALSLATLTPAEKQEK